MKNCFKEAERIIKQENIKAIKRKKNQRKHLINTIDSLISGGISVFDLEVVNKNAIKINYRDKIKEQNIKIRELEEKFNQAQILIRSRNERIRDKDKIINLMAEQLAGLAIFDNDIENALILGDKEEVKNYYERKAANEEE